MRTVISDNDSVGDSIIVIPGYESQEQGVVSGKWWCQVGRNISRCDVRCVWKSQPYHKATERAKVRYL